MLILLLPAFLWAMPLVTRPAVVPAPPMITAADWGSQPQAMDGEVRHKPVKVTLHHAGELWKDTDVPARKIKALQGWGQRDKGWPDVPYHFLIAPDGRIVEGRSVDYAGETNTRYDTSGHLLIMCWGNFEVQRITAEQMRSAVRMAAHLCDRYNIDPATLAGHNDAAPGQTSCPGRDFDRYIDDGTFQKWVEAALRGEEPKIEIRPALPNGPTTFPSTQPVN